MNDLFGVNARQVSAGARYQVLGMTYGYSIRYDLFTYAPSTVLENDVSMKDGLKKFCLISAYGRSEAVALYRAYNKLLEKEKERLTWVSDSTDSAHPEDQIDYHDAKLLRYRGKIEKILYPNGNGSAEMASHGYLIRNMLLNKKNAGLLQKGDEDFFEVLKADLWGQVGLFVFSLTIRIANNTLLERTKNVSS